MISSKAKRAMTGLRQCEKLSRTFGPTTGGHKLPLLHALQRATLPTAVAVQRLHELLCFMRAYPDDEQILDTVEAMLEGFDQRRDLRRHARKLIKHLYRRHAD